MKFMISYFYQIRNFTPNMIPISTAVTDPKWYYHRDGQRTYRNRNGVVNGVRYSTLSSLYVGSNNRCEGRDCQFTPDDCPFLRSYKAYLNSLDFDQVITELAELASTFRLPGTLSQEVIPTLIVYEAPSNSCSERQSLIDWFSSNGVSLIEFIDKKGDN